MRIWHALHTLFQDERGFLLPAAIGLMAGQLFGGGGGGGSRTPELTSEQRELLDIQRRRLLQSNPLYEAILRLAMQLLPGGGMSPPPSGGPGEGGAPGSPLLAPEGREPFLPEGALSERVPDGGARAGASVGSNLLTRNLGTAISRLFPGALQRTSQRASLDASQQAASRAAISALARRASFGPALTADLASGAGWGNLPGGVGELAQIRAESRDRASRIDQLMDEMNAATLDIPGGPGGPELFA